jgi:hypothetical protein
VALYWACWRAHLLRSTSVIYDSGFIHASMTLRSPLPPHISSIRRFLRFVGSLSRLKIISIWHRFLRQCLTLLARPRQSLRLPAKYVPIDIWSGTRYFGRFTQSTGTVSLHTTGWRYTSDSRLASRQDALWVFLRSSNLRLIASTATIYVSSIKDIDSLHQGFEFSGSRFNKFPHFCIHHGRV